jgi:hypothetical protein
MINVNRYLAENGLESLLLVQVHDSILLDMVPSEFHHIGAIRECLNSAYPQLIIGMDTSVEHSFDSWFDLKKGYPGLQLEHGEATGSQISLQDQTSVGVAAAL